jgi:uncharacterized delta-60 repeat protein
MKTAFTLFIICFFSYSSFAQSGTLDSSFGDSGKVISKDLGSCNDMAIQTDNKIVCEGMNHTLFQLVRYLPDGKIDSLFGNNGIVNPIVRETFNEAFSVLIQNDGKILLSGDGYKNGISTIVLMRFMPDGSFDKNFATYGIADSTFGIGESFSHIALQPDGKILLLGDYYPGFILIRYNPDGTLDENFGDKGKILTAFGAGTVPTAIAIKPDGKIITAGNYGGGVGYSKFLLAQYSTEGVLDESFGNKGVITTDFGKYGDLINSIAIQADGKIIAAGVTGVRDIGDVENMAIIRYNTDGSIDKDFGLDGKTTIVFNDVNSKITDIVIEKDEKILLGGSTYQKLYYGDLDFLVSRLNLSGLLDSSFGTNGITLTDFGSYDGAEAIALQQDKIILAGENSINGENPHVNYALARYNNDEANKKQIIIKKIKHYIATHNNAQATSLNSISIYPNPAQNVLHIAGLSSSNTKLTVVDFSGTVRQQAVANTSFYNLNISALATGNYLLKIEMNGDVVTKKFVKE